MQPPMSEPPRLHERVAARRPPESPRVMRQIWRDLLFLHWSLPAEALRPLIPHELEVDTFDGRAWVSLIPLRISGVRPRFAPPVPGLSRFLEVNLRTYVHRAGRDPGIWFFSLDATSALAVAGARMGYRLPYYRAAAAVAPAEQGHLGELEWRSRRRRGGAGCHLRGGPTGNQRLAARGSLEYFLIERYVLYAARELRLYRARVEHAPYRVYDARANLLEESLLAAAGIRRPDAPPLVHYSPEVRVWVHPPERV